MGNINIISQLKYKSDGSYKVKEAKWQIAGIKTQF